MAQAPLDWLLSIGDTTLLTSAKTLTGAINELFHSLASFGSQTNGSLTSLDAKKVNKTDVLNLEEIKSATDLTDKVAAADSVKAVNAVADTKVSKSDVLGLEEIEASTDLTNKVASASAVEALNNSRGGCDFSVEDGEAYITYDTGTETVKKKLGNAKALTTKKSVKSGGIKLNGVGRVNFSVKFDFANEVLGVVTVSDSSAGIVSISGNTVNCVYNSTYTSNTGTTYVTVSARGY